MENTNFVSTSEIQNFLVRRLGEQEGNEIMVYINDEIDKNVEARVGESKKIMKENFATKEDSISLENKLVKRVSSVEGTLILWGFVFWITLIIAMYVIFKFIQ